MACPLMYESDEDAKRIIRISANGMNQKATNHRANISSSPAVEPHQQVVFHPLMNAKSRGLFPLQFRPIIAGFPPFFQLNAVLIARFVQVLSHVRDGHAATETPL